MLGLRDHTFSKCEDGLQASSTFLTVVWQNQIQRLYSDVSCENLPAVSVEINGNTRILSLSKNKEMVIGFLWIWSKQKVIICSVWNL